MITNTFNLSSFIEAYVTTMQWSTSGTDQNGEDLESLEGFSLSNEAQEKVTNDCKCFIEQNWQVLDLLPKHYDYSDAGHDFWLTRNGHGAGFWDRGLGELGDLLTKAAETFKQCDPYIGDDGKIYF